jgi:hypothetical protein
MGRNPPSWFALALCSVGVWLVGCGAEPAQEDGQACETLAEDAAWEVREPHDQESPVCQYGWARDLASDATGAVFVETDDGLQKYGPNGESLWVQSGLALRPVTATASGGVMGLLQGSIAEVDADGEFVSQIELPLGADESVSAVVFGGDRWFAVGHAPAEDGVGWDNWIASYTLDGTLLWRDPDAGSSPIAAVDDGGLVNTETRDDGDLSTTNIYVRRLDAEGSLLWEQPQWPTGNRPPGTRAADLAVSRDGFIAVVGSNSNDGEMGWVSLFDPDGDLLWYREGEEGLTEAFAAAFDDCDVLHVVGHHPDQYDRSAWAQFALDGALLNRAAFHADSLATDLHVDDTGSVWVAGFTDYGTCLVGEDWDDDETGLWIRRLR